MWTGLGGGRGPTGTLGQILLNPPGQLSVTTRLPCAPEEGLRRPPRPPLLPPGLRAPSLRGGRPRRAPCSPSASGAVTAGPAAPRPGPLFTSLEEAQRLGDADALRPCGSRYGRAGPGDTSPAVAPSGPCGSSTIHTLHGVRPARLHSACRPGAGRRQLTENPTRAGPEGSPRDSRGSTQGAPGKRPCSEGRLGFKGSASPGWGG